MTEAIWFDQFTLEISVNIDVSNFFNPQMESKRGRVLHFRSR
jgi:hypothetical protein